MSEAIEARRPRCGREKFDEGELALHSRVALTGARLWLRLARRLVVSCLPR